MTKKEFYEENYLNLLNQAKEELSDMIKAIIKRVNEIDGEDEVSITLHEFAISSPIYREDLFNDEMSEVIFSAFVDSEGKVGFEVATFDSGSIDDLNMDMITYLIGEFENVDVNEIMPK
jgi:predicted Zn-dependent protease with MMP-like domain